MARKQPALLWYVGDWMKDPCVSLCKPATRGIWMDLLCAMHEAGRVGYLRGTTEQLARLARCSPAELSHALTDLKDTKAAEVEQRNGFVAVTCRRMRREAEKREVERDKKRKQRCPPTCPSNVALEDEDESNSSKEKAFDEFWDAFPPGRKRSKGSARKAFAKALEKVPANDLIAAARHYATTPQGKGKYVQMPSTWLNGECWDDDRAAWESTEADPAEEAKRKAHAVREQERKWAQEQNERIRQENARIAAERIANKKP